MLSGKQHKGNAQDDDVLIVPGRVEIGGGETGRRKDRERIGSSGNSGRRPKLVAGGVAAVVVGRHRAGPRTKES